MLPVQVTGRHPTEQIERCASKSIALVQAGTSPADVVVRQAFSIAIVAIACLRSLDCEKADTTVTRVVLRQLLPI
jgi:hypothetical protein